MAAEAGTDYSGVLCGRATWKEGMPIYAKQGVKGAGGLAVHGRREEHQRGERAIKPAKPWYVKAAIPQPAHA